MRFSPSNLANAVAWGVIAGLICAAVVIVRVLGSVGLLILGAGTWLVYVRMKFDQDISTWNAEAFTASLERVTSPAQRAAMLEERWAFTSSLRFYRSCGIFLGIAGIVGFLVQLWCVGDDCYYETCARVG